MGGLVAIAALVALVALASGQRAVVQGWSTDSDCSTLELVDEDAAAVSAMSAGLQYENDPPESLEETEARMLAYFRGLFPQCADRVPSSVRAGADRLAWPAFVELVWNTVQLAEQDVQTRAAAHVHIGALAVVARRPQPGGFRAS